MAAETPRMAPGPARRPHRILRGTLLFLLAITLGSSGWFLFGRPRPTAVPLTDLETGEGVAQRSINLDTTRTRRGLPSIRVGAKEMLTYEDGHTELHDIVLTIFGSDGDRTEVSAPLAISNASGGGWSFRNGVEVRDGRGLKVLVPEIQYRESPQEVGADGDVAFERGGLKGRATGLRYHPALRRVEFLSSVELESGLVDAGLRTVRAETAIVDQRASTIRFTAYTAEGKGGETLSGRTLDVFLDERGKEARIVQATEGFTAEADPAGASEGLLGRGMRSLSGEKLRIDLLPKGGIGSVEATGSVSLATVEETAGKRTLSSDRLLIGFEGGRPASLLAEGGASLEILGREGRETTPVTLRSQALRATLSPSDGSLLAVWATGGATASDGGRKLYSETIQVDPQANAWILEGVPGADARVEAEGAIVSASKIEIHRADGSLSAKGGVKTVSQPSAARAPQPRGTAPSPGPSVRPAAGMFDGSGPVHGMAEAVTLSRSGRVARYRVSVRIWQGSSSLEASSVDIMDESGIVEARGGVVARVPAKKKDSAENQIITISSSEMRYSRESGEAGFEGKVRAQASAIRVSSDRLTAKKGGEGGGIQSVDAEGNVSFQQGTRTGSGDTLTARLGDERFVLTGRGRLAIIQDQSSQQVVKGSVLTYEGATDRILVESESGGRTWVTLKPRPDEGKKGGDPEPPR